MSSPLCTLPHSTLTAADLVSSDQFRGRLFKLAGGGFLFDSAERAVGGAAGLIRIARGSETLAGGRRFVRFVHPMQRVHLCG